jgi:hypothetical protein
MMGILPKLKASNTPQLLGDSRSAIGHRIHGAAIYGNMDPINISPMLAYIPYTDPMGSGGIDAFQNLPCTNMGKT